MKTKLFITGLLITLLGFGLFVGTPWIDTVSITFAKTTLYSSPVIVLIGAIIMSASVKQRTYKAGDIVEL